MRAETTRRSLIGPAQQAHDALFPWSARDETGRLTTDTGLALDAHLARRDSARAQTVATFVTMASAEFRRTRALPAYDVTPEWVIQHLRQHEAEHRGEIGVTLGRARAAGTIG
jgi:anti-sigma factor RsiW